MSSVRVNEFVRGKGGVTADTALRLARLYKTTPQFWMHMGVRRLVLGEGLPLACGGAIAGLLLAMVTTRVLRSLLFETEPLDPTTLLAAAAVFVVAALVATCLPARHATKVDRMTVLRDE
jgi:predicted lysophospholipase L1 biosynthesis ABC-type transport system permease subunit